jgi:hypothetical protein
MESASGPERAARATLLQDTVPPKRPGAGSPDGHTGPDQEI